MCWHILFKAVGFWCRSGHQARLTWRRHAAQCSGWRGPRSAAEKWNLCRHSWCMSGARAQPPSSSRSRARRCAHTGAETLFSFHSILPVIPCEDETDGVWWNMERGVQREENMTVNASFWAVMKINDGRRWTPASSVATRPSHSASGADLLVG